MYATIRFFCYRTFSPLYGNYNVQGLGLSSFGGHEMERSKWNLWSRVWISWVSSMPGEPIQFLHQPLQALQVCSDRCSNRPSEACQSNLSNLRTTGNREELRPSTYAILAPKHLYTFSLFTCVYIYIHI